MGFKLACLYLKRPDGFDDLVLLELGGPGMAASPKSHGVKASETQEIQWCDWLGCHVPENYVLGPDRQFPCRSELLEYPQVFPLGLKGTAEQDKSHH